jgi:pimeloyl-ACP methyl ester carboxylesterase
LEVARSLKSNRKKKGIPRPVSLNIRSSLCGTFTVAAEKYYVPLTDGGSIPMDRRCSITVYGHTDTSKGAVLLIPGFASNRAVFDVGGGKGRTGPSFFEYLANQGYDTYSIDLRGSRQALSLGTKSPAFLKEHVEVDVPCAIRHIKSIGHQKVYLIGHSMGGAISCAVAGFIPDDVAGIVHVRFFFPSLSDICANYMFRLHVRIFGTLACGSLPFQYTLHPRRA